MAPRWGGSGGIGVWVLEGNATGVSYHRGWRSEGTAHGNLEKNLSAAKFPVGFYKSQMNGRSLEGINGDVVKRCGCKQFGNDFVIVNQFTLTKECY